MIKILYLMNRLVARGILIKNKLHLAQLSFHLSSLAKWNQTGQKINRLLHFFH